MPESPDKRNTEEHMPIDPRIFDPNCPTCQAYRRTWTPCNHMHHSSDEQDVAKDCTSNENCDHPTHYSGCPIGMAEGE